MLGEAEPEWLSEEVKTGVSKLFVYVEEMSQYLMCAASLLY